MSDGRARQDMDGEDANAARECYSCGPTDAHLTPIPVGDGETAWLEWLCDPCMGRSMQ